MSELTTSEVIASLFSNYSAVYYVDVDTSEVQFINLGERISTYMGEVYKTKKTMMEYATIYAEKLVLPEYREAFLREVNPQNLVKQLADKDYYIYTYLGDKNGNPNYYRMRAAKVNGSLKKLVIGFADVDEEIRKEEELKRTLKATAEKLEQANNAKTRFLTNISHELNTPLNAMCGYSTIAEMRIRKMDDPDKKLISAVENIATSAKHMNYMVQNILDVAEMERGARPLQEGVCNLKSMAKELVVIFEEDAKAKEVSICPDLSGIDHAKVWGDQIKINRVLMNLLGNAVKYSKPGGYVYLNFTEKAINANESEFEIHVEDNGQGMDPEYVAHCYEIFSRERDSVESGITGFGLGLSIVKSNLDQMRGRINIESEKGIGTKVTVSIPLKLV